MSYYCLHVIPSQRKKWKEKKFGFLVTFGAVINNLKYRSQLFFNFYKRVLEKFFTPAQLYRARAVQIIGKLSMCHMVNGSKNITAAQKN